MQGAGFFCSIFRRNDAMNFDDDVKYAINRRCDRCNQPIWDGETLNSSLLVEELVAGGFQGFFGDRHLLPTKDCCGSPSRQKLLETDESWKEMWHFVQQSEIVKITKLCNIKKWEV
jgi:hypothetical protein